MKFLPCVQGVGSPIQGQTRSDRPECPFKSLHFLPFFVLRERSDKNEITGDLCKPWVCELVLPPGFLSGRNFYTPCTDKESDTGRLVTYPRSHSPGVR